VKINEPERSSSNQSLSQKIDHQLTSDIYTELGGRRRIFSQSDVEIFSNSLKEEVSPLVGTLSSKEYE
jgi:hypothetical protein